MSLLEFQLACSSFDFLCKKMEADPASVEDVDILRVFGQVRDGMQANCGAAADRLFAMSANVAAAKPHLELDVLPDAMQPIYYLGAEDLSTLQGYLSGLADKYEPCVLRPVTMRDYLSFLINKCRPCYLVPITKPGYRYLRSLTTPERQGVLIEAFRRMYAKEDNSSQTDEPAILK